MKTDYENIVEYKQNGSQEAFTELYTKYYKYVREYARNIYYMINECDGGIAQEDIEQYLIEKCIMNQINNMDISRIRPNFNFQIRLAKYLKGYRNALTRKYKRRNITYSYDHEVVDVRSFEDKKRGNTIHSIGFQINKKLSYSPEEEYIDKIDNTRQSLNDRLNKNEQRFLKYLEKGLTLNQIANKLHVSMGSIGKLKKELKEKCYSIVLEG